MKKFTFNSITKAFVDGIDDLNIIKKAFKVMYYIFGVIIGLLPIFLIFLGIKKIAPMGIHSLKFIDGWPKAVLCILGLVFLILIIFMFYVCFKYWKKHGDDFGKSTSNYPNIAFAADFIQTFNNTNVFLSVFTVSAFSILAYLFCVLTGAGNFYSGFNFLIYLATAIGAILAYALVGLISIMLVGWLTESLKLVVQIGTDLRDVADIMRVSEVSVDNQSKPQLSVTENIENN